MPFELGVPKDGDFEEIVPMMFQAMGRNSQFVNAVWPHGSTEKGQNSCRERFLFMKQMDPSVRWRIVTDTDSGEIVGAAQWNLYEGGEKPAEMVVDGPAGTWDNEDEKEYAQAIFRLNFMAVAPKHQRRGAGKMLTGWGVKLADDIGALCTVEASGPGRNLYEKFGFVVERRWTLPVPEKFADRPQEGQCFMVRPRKA